MIRLNPYKCSSQTFNIKQTFFLEQTFGEGATWSCINAPKTTDAFIYFLNCDGEYLLPSGNNFFVPRGSIVYLPIGSEYIVKFKNIKSNPCDLFMSCVLEYDNKLAKLWDEPAIVATETPQKEFLEIYNSGIIECSKTNISFLKTHAYAYNLLHLITNQQNTYSLTSKKFAPIAEGVKYLQQNTIITKSIEEIASMCQLSSGRFRNLFKEYMGISPIEYRTKIIMEHAKRLLLSQEYTVTEVSDMLNFTDVAYFSKTFKKYYGLPPIYFTR